jgi:hypothetical protein
MAMGPEDSWLLWSAVARNLATALTFVAALCAGLFGLFRYLRSERVRQAEQVLELFRMFFVSGRFQTIRFALANPGSEAFERLRLETEADGMPGALKAELIEYLNFLEFVCGLTRRGLVARSDVDWMFSGFIAVAARTDFVRALALGGDFTELPKRFSRRIR